MKPDSTENLQEKVRREKVGKRFTSNLVTGSQIPPETVEINQTTKSAAPSRNRIAVQIPSDIVHAWLEKVVRGMLHFHSGKFIEPPFRIDFYPFLTSQGVQDVKEALGGMTANYANGPGISVHMGVAEDEVTSVFLIHIWEQIYMGASVTSDNDSLIDDQDVATSAK
jgi:hypothetical protein